MTKLYDGKKTAEVGVIFGSIRKEFKRFFTQKIICFYSSNIDKNVSENEKRVSH